MKGTRVAVLGFHDGSAGQIETWFEQVTGYHIACFVDECVSPCAVDVEAENKKRVSQRTEFPAGNSFKGRPLITSLDWISEISKIGISKVLPLTPNNQLRRNQVMACQKNGLELVSAIHPTVTILAGATIEAGVWINAGSIIGYKAEIEAGVLINTRVSVDHHNVLRKCCCLDPGVITAGFVTIGECSHIHTGVTIINRREIGTEAIVGAGAVVIDDIPPKCTAVGVPARMIKCHYRDER
ncbi:MAG: acetyltransferase [Desulfomonilaceae bacterium]